jgi:hypothetical protein
MFRLPLTAKLSVPVTVIRFNRETGTAAVFASSRLLKVPTPSFVCADDPPRQSALPAARPELNTLPATFYSLSSVIQGSGNDLRTAPTLSTPCEPASVKATPAGLSIVKLLSERGACINRQGLRTGPVLGGGVGARCVIVPACMSKFPQLPGQGCWY